MESPTGSDRPTLERTAFYQVQSPKVNVQQAYPQGAGRLSFQELTDIQERPPTVPYETYIKYRTQGLPQELSPIIPEDELFYLLTRTSGSKVPGQSQAAVLSPTAHPWVERWYAYQDLQPHTQSLLDDLYGSRLNYLLSETRSPYEEHLIFYDMNMRDYEHLFGYMEQNLGITPPYYGQDWDLYYYDQLRALVPQWKLLSAL